MLNLLTGAPGLSPLFATRHHPAISCLMTSTDRLKALLVLSARLTILADKAHRENNRGLEAALISSAAEILTSSGKIAVATNAPVFIHRLAQAIENIEIGLDADGSLIPRPASH
ncbi:hypothetical protein [Rhizobium sp. WYJ-E13]|jgi:hypothetical protein|uniref:hypothetical protein n=1 Tax=Rhizobium sp. WYJ-E13 TaxID=2849093 RepID=UPI001C1F1792|nr:hypothetical protein [Rhizobium sp. WYJ-E13]QWW72468.1 hypothetical protein KQ933_31595 [Rhizobium sp. WYJ-E13]